MVRNSPTGELGRAIRAIVKTTAGEADRSAVAPGIWGSRGAAVGPPGSGPRSAGVIRAAVDIGGFRVRRQGRYGLNLILE